MSRYRRQLTRPEIARLAAETTELRRELLDLVSHGRPKAVRAMDGEGRAKRSVTEPPASSAPTLPPGRTRTRR